MATDRISGSSTRHTLSVVTMVLGALLLLVMPAILLFFAFTQAQSVHLPGTLVILSSAGGMALVIIGATLRD